MKTHFNRQGPARLRAVTLLEILIVIAIIGILTGLAVPSLLSFAQLNQVNALSREFISAMDYAKNEAIKRNNPVILCVRDPNNTGGCNATNDNWAAGWSVFSGTTPASNKLLTVNDRDLSSSINLTGNTGTSTAVNSITFDTNGFPNNTINFTLLPKKCFSNNERLLTLSATGRLSMTNQTCPAS